jgi:anti-anti-sigma factor
MIEHDAILHGNGNGSASSRSMRTRVVFTGEYDLAVKEQLRDELDSLVDEPAVVLDFSDVSYMDSTCVAELMRNRELRASRGLPPPTIIIKAGNRIRRIFEILGLLTAFDFVEELPPSETQFRYACAGSTDELTPRRASRISASAS